MLSDILSDFINSDMEIKSASVLLYYNSNEASIRIEASDMIDGENVRISRFIVTTQDVIGNMGSNDIIDFIHDQRNKFDSTNKNDLIKLGKVMKNITSPVKKSYIVSECYFEKLMLLRPIQFYICWLLSLVKFIKGKDTAIKLFSYMVLSSKTQDECYENIIHQMIFGKDFSCDFSAGGFNQEELDKLQEIIKKYN